MYKAEDTKLDRPVALKFLPAHLLGDADIRKRFEREAKAAAALDHPNVCHVYGSLDMTMTKADLVEEISRVVEITRKEAEVVAETILESIVQALREGDKVEIRSFGSFRTRQRAGRIGRNPKTGQSVAVPSKTIAFFTPSKEVLESINSK